MEKELKRNELNPDELENVSGGSWASRADEMYADSLNSSIPYKYGNDIGKKANAIFNDMAQSGDSYSVQDFKTRIKEQLGIDI